jgi:hypothetical protein
MCSLRLEDRPRPNRTIKYLVSGLARRGQRLSGLTIKGVWSVPLEDHRLREWPFARVKEWAMTPFQGKTGP